MTTRTKRDEILDTAIELAKSHGYNRLTYKQVADAAYVPRSLIYYYFPSTSTLSDHILTEARRRREYRILVQALATNDEMTKHFTPEEKCSAINSLLG